MPRQKKVQQSSKYDYEKILRVWQRSESLEQVAKETGLTLDQVRYVGAVFRRHELVIRKLNGVPHRTDWARLKELSRELLPKEK